MRLLLVPTLFVGLIAASPGRAAESYDSCSGFIDSVPATISTQGVWCLRADLSTAISSGSAITINANNVTIDCNNFKLGGLGGGPGSIATGVFSNRTNASVRNCNIRGFWSGIEILSLGGNLVESNRLDGNLAYGIYTAGAGSTIRNNQVFDTGGSTESPNLAIGIYGAEGTDIVGNTVYGVSTNGESFFSYGIATVSNGTGSIRGNRIKGVLAAGGSSSGIHTFISGRVVVRDNDIQGIGAPGSIGVRCENNQGTSGGNFIAGFETAVQGCMSVGDTLNPN